MSAKTLSMVMLGLCLAASISSHATVSRLNIDSLRTYVYTTGNEFVYLQGYHTIDDGGQGIFGWDPANTQSDNNGTIIKVNTVATGRWVRVFKGAMSVKWFGAKGDSVTDDQPAITNALYAAMNAGVDLFLPGATYKLNSYWAGDTAAHNIFSYTTASTHSIRIFGEQQTILRSALYPALNKTNSFFFFNGALVHCTIENIFFQNTHPLPSGSNIGQTTAISLRGDAGVANKGFKIIGCHFEGFSTAIFATGTEDTHIERCSFNAPLGRDNAQGTNTQPAVFIWFISDFSGGGGEVINPTVINCTANGYSGTGPIATSTVSKAPMESFVYGNPEGALISGNMLSNMGIEIIDVSPNLGDLAKKNPVMISNNIIDCAIPKGSIGVGGSSPATANYGIRCEAKSSVITGNTLNNATQGIFQYAFDTWLYQFRRWQIQDNVIRFTTDTSQSPVFGIYVQGDSGLSTFRAQCPVIINNTMVADSLTLKGSPLTAINVNDADSAVVTGNTFILGNVNRAGQTINFSSMTVSYNTWYKNNIIRGQPDAQYVVSGSSTYTDWDNFSAQMVRQVTSNVTITAADATVIGNAASGNFTVTLPSPSDPTVSAKTQGKKFVFRNITSGSMNTMTISTPSGHIVTSTVTSGSTLVIAAGTTVGLQTDGTNWYVL